MKLEQASYSLDNVIQIKESVHEYLKQRNNEEIPTVTNDRISGGILSDTRYSWLSCGPRLQVLHTKSGAKVAAWCFRAQHDFETCVTCICDLPNTRGKAPLLVVGLECEITGGMLCVFDVGSSRVLRAIQIDDKVTSIEVVSGGGDSGLPGVLRALDGVIAVGTAKGKVLLVDLCRQLCEEAISNTSNESIRDEINSCNLIQISFEDLRNLERHKEMSLNKGDHLCLQLNEDSTSGIHFSLFGPTGDLRLRANKSEVIISSLHFSQALGSLLIGFNFGAWQLYHLVATPYPVLAYTSPMYEDCVPVSHFAVQEPCDDPRAFCYVWVVYSVQETDIVRDSETDTAMSVMYSLTYTSKEYLEDYGVIYQDLQACAVRFQIELANIVPGGRSTAARCVALRAYTRQLSVDAPEERLALCSIVWTCWDTANPTVAPETYLALFDLNQWYKEQMPGQPRAETDRYMVCVNVTELMANYGDGQVATEDILDLRLDSSSLSPFTCSQRLEEHYYPSALAFKSLVVSDRRLSCVVSSGSQRHLLGQLELAGPLCLLQPSELYMRCVSLGLYSGSDVTATARQQREAVLSVALEHQLVRWLCRCARDWASGAQSSAGCTLDFLLDWAWQRANTLKFTCDKLCVPLFDHTGQRLDHNALQQLNHAACQIKHLSTLFDTVLNYCYMYFTEQDIEDIRYQHNTLSMITTYLEVLQWLLNVGLLPECPLSMYPLPDHAERLSAPYPADSLSRFYNSRRTELQNKEESSLLFIDQLISLECGGERLIAQWKGDGGSGWYPPPSLQALLRTYLVEDIDMQYKHCLVIYVFLDLAMTLDQSRYKSIITHLIKFPAVFQLSPSVIKITQAFWQLDHGDFSTAMAQFLDPAVASEDLKPWHHRTVLKALLVQGQHQHALLYHQVRKPPVSSIQDTCIIITLLIVNDLLQEAFHFQRQNRSVYNEQEILKHFFSVSDKVNHLNNVLQLPLSPIEESSFISYLRANPSETNENLLVIYYLQRDRYDEAFRANDALNAEFNKKHVKQGILGQQERNFRNVIVEGFKKTLPDVTQVLLDTVEKEKMLLKEATWQNFARPLPMSVFVHNTQEQAKYKSTLIQASFRKAKETWTHKLHDDDNETPFISTPKVLPAKDKSNGTPLIYATAMHLPTSTSAELNIDAEVTPAKRMRLSPRQPISETLRRKQRLSAGQSPSLSLLDTPIVKRKSYRDSPASSIVGTPASILKVRSFIRSSVSPDTKDDRGTSTTPENLEPDLPDTEMEVDAGFLPLDRSTANAIKSVGLSLNRRSSLGVSPRRPITRTPRPAVHFEDAAPRPSSRCSDGSDKSGGKQHLEVCIEVHREQTPDISSKDSSLSIDDVFYSPDASVSDRSKDNTVNEEVQVEEDVRMSLKRKATDSVKSRRSYKAATPVIKVTTPVIKVTTPVIKVTTPVIKVERNLRSRNSSLTPVKTSEPSPEPRKSEVFPKLGGRRSLTRQVLEQNTLAKVLNVPKMQTRLSLNARENEKTVGVEVSYSKTVTSIVKKTSDTVTEEKCDKSTVEMKNTFTTETDLDKKQTIKHVHNESSSKSSVKKLSEVVDEDDKINDSFTSCITDKTDSNYHILSSSSDVDESFIRKLKWDEHKDETINKSVANTTQYTSDENVDSIKNISMEEIIEQPDIPKYNFTQTVFEDISSIIETSYEDEEESKAEEDMETSIPEEIINIVSQTEESVVNIDESMEEIKNKVPAQIEESVVNIEETLETTTQKEIIHKVLAQKEESVVNIEETSVQVEIINTVQPEEVEAAVNIEESNVQQQTINKQAEEESIVDIEESSKDSSESEKISNQSSDNEESHQQEESSQSSVESSKPHNYLVPSSDENSDEEEKTSNQDEEEDLKFVYEEIEEEQEVEEPEDTEDPSTSEEESNHSSRSSDVIEIKSSSEDSQHVDDLNICEEKQIAAEDEEDQEEMEEEHDPLQQDKDQEKIEEDLKLNISEEKQIEAEDEQDQEEMEEEHDPLEQDKDQAKVGEDLKLNISEEKQVEAEDEQEQEEMEEEHDLLEQDKNQEKVEEDLKLNISEEKQIEAEDEQDQEEMEKEHYPLQQDKDQEKLEEEPDQVEEENQEEIVERISEKSLITEQENILEQNVYEPSSISEQVVENEEIIQTIEPIQDSIQQEEDMDIPEDIQQEIEECMQEEQQLQEPSTTENKSKDSSKSDISQDCLEIMSFTTPQEQLQTTDILCNENFADKPTEEILEIETDTQVEQTETGTDLLENLPEKSYTPSRRSKRISSKQQEEIQPTREDDIPARTTRKRSNSIDVEKIEPSPARITRKRSTSVDIGNTEPLETKSQARITRKRSTSVDIEDVPLENRKSPGRTTRKRSTSTDEPPKPTRASTRTRSTSVDIDPKPVRSSTRRRSTNSDVEEILKPATRTRKRSTSVDIEDERSTRASSVVSLPAIPEEVNSNKPKSSSPSRRGRKRSITVIPEESESEEHVKKAALENIPEKIEEYSATHRLTRRQKTMMEKSLEIQELKKLQPQEVKPKLAKIEDNLEVEEHLATSPSSVSTDTQSTDPGTPHRRSSRRLSTTSTPTRRSTRNSRDAADDDSSVKSVPVIKLDREDVVRYRSLSPTALKEPAPSPKVTKGRRKSIRSSILPVQTDLSKISEETVENEPSSSQETRAKRGRPRKNKDNEEQSSQSSEERETKLTKRKTSSFGPYIRKSVIQARKSFKIKTTLTRK